jgi:UDP-glucose 4-epimerase
LITWTIGAGGLIGGAIARRLAQEPDSTTFEGPAIPWADTSSAIELLNESAKAFAEATADRSWAIIWAAGVATVSTEPEKVESELTTLTALVAAIKANPPKGKGVFFLVSSAGGVYAGSAGSPFSADTPIKPLSAYGELKAQQEQVAATALDGVCPVIIGRFSNVYGPGQNLGKLQGLISQLAMATATRQPINIFVSLDTIRDYIFVDDASDQVAYWITRAAIGCNIELIASGEPVALSQLIRTMESVTKRKVPVALGSHPSSSHQVLDLRFNPWNATGSAENARPLKHTPLPVGTKLVYQDILARMQI